jgi:subtilase family serine protease
VVASGAIQHPGGNVVDLLRRVIVMLLGVSALSAAPAVAGAAGLPANTTARVLAPAELHGTFFGAIAPSTHLSLYVALAGQHDGDADRLIQSQNSPGSPWYRHYLTPQQYGRFFGAPRHAYARALETLRAHGFVIDELFANRTDIVVHASAAIVESFFNTPIDLRSENGRVFFTNRYDPQLPAGLGILSVAGLEDYAQWRPHFGHLNPTPESRIGKIAGWGPPDIQSAYDLTPIYAKYSGATQTVIDATYGFVRATDFAAFAKQFGLNATLEQEGSKKAPEDPYGESTLDVEYMAAVAPSVKILLYTASDQEMGFLKMHARIINDLSDHHIVSTSWGFCEQQFTQAFKYYASDDERLFRQAALEGQWWMAAAGDQGADDCEMTRNAPIAVDFPGSSPYVMSVGGTRLTPKSRANGDYTGWENEVVWNDSCGSSGGGYSTLFVRPAYQGGLVHTYMRQVPDVALMADGCDDGGYIISLKGKFQNTWYGTSFAAPEWAAFLTLIQERYGETAIASPLYRLYNLGSTPAYGSLFHNIVEGCNGYNGVPGFCAHTGVSATSGLGSFIGAPLAEAY